MRTTVRLSEGLLREAKAEASRRGETVTAGCEWITTDRGYARFPGLRWRTPFTS